MIIFGIIANKQETIDFYKNKCPLIVSRNFQLGQEYYQPVQTDVELFNILKNKFLEISTDKNDVLVFIRDTIIGQYTPSMIQNFFEEFKFYNTLDLINESIPTTIITQGNSADISISNNHKNYFDIKCFRRFIFDVIGDLDVSVIQKDNLWDSIWLQMNIAMARIDFIALDTIQTSIKINKSIKSLNTYREIPSIPDKYKSGMEFLDIFTSISI